MAIESGTTTWSIRFAPAKGCFVVALMTFPRSVPAWSRGDMRKMQQAMDTAMVVFMESPWVCLQFHCRESMTNRQKKGGRRSNPWYQKTEMVRWNDSESHS